MGAKILLDLMPSSGRPWVIPGSSLRSLGTLPRSLDQREVAEPVGSHIHGGRVPRQYFCDLFREYFGRRGSYRLSLVIDV